ncbi:MAG: ABC transporter ATP-binding protein/permease [Lachnospiraceae bacterium]|nr:ABC transporter ATP-binding protein/permease [Lachnospiraceae bacterium]
MSKNDKKNGSLQTLKKVLKIIGRYKLLLALSIVLATLTVVLQLYIPILFGYAIDGIIAEGKVDFGSIETYLFKTLILIAIASIATWVMNAINNRLAYHVVRDIRAKAIRQIERLPLSFLDSHGTGDIVGRVIADTDQLSDGLLLGFTQLFSGIVTILVTIFFMFSKNVVISVMVIALTPISFLVARFIATHTYAMFQKQTYTRGLQTALVEEMVGNQKVVKAFGYEEKAEARFDVLNKELKEYSRKALFYSSLTNPCTRAVNNVIYALVALVGANRIMAGGLTVGGLSVLLAYANQYMKPFNDISSVITELQNALACAGRIFELIETKPERKDSPQVMDMAKGNVTIDDVSFSYNKEKKLIEHFSLDVKPGTRVAIVGPTGCGKTTFINLLMRFYDVDAGAIKVDDWTITDVARHSLRRNYGMVLQETWIKNATIRENIAFGKPDATDEEIIKAAKEAHSWGFIRRMPKKLDTVINENSLSQGQKQLLCITRVMLLLPPMLILDEATSSIDTRTEVKISEAFDKMMEGRTSFIVAHRLSTIRNADVILVMKDGKIIEQGNHETLLAKKGFYEKLYNSQFEHVAV